MKIYFKRHFLECSYSFFGRFGTFLMLSPSSKQLLAFKHARARARTPCCLISCGCVECVILAQLAFFPSSMINWPLSWCAPPSLRCHWRRSKLESRERAVVHTPALMSRSHCAPTTLLFQPLRRLEQATAGG